METGMDSRRGVGRLTALLASGLLVTVSACAVKAPPDTAELRSEAMPSAAIPTHWTAAGAAAGVVGDNWVVSFQDDQLVLAVSEAIAHNADLRVGASRVEQALLQARMAGAKLYPSADLLARGGTKMSGDGSGLQGGVFTVNWELDLWARVRSGRAAAAADAMSVATDYEYARQSVAALVARSWFLATEASLQGELARAAVADVEAMVRLAETRAKVGVGNEEDVYIARASVGTTLDTLRQIELAREQAIRALELVLGRYPAAVAGIRGQLPVQPAPIPAGLPSELLERRPDVVAAERRVAAAFHRIQEAKAARLPAITLTTGVSSISSELFVLQDHENPVWNLGANLLAPIYKGGALRTQVKIRTAEQKVAVAAYAAVGLRAFGEVENALSGEIAARDRERILAQSVADSRRALEIVQSQYKVGSTDLRAVTQRQLALNANQSALVRVQTEQRVQRVNLHLALGGSFEPRPAPPTTTP
jgi:NodT family efflux transporter outer membrane factor (OMF) lipoprotein